MAEKIVEMERDLIREMLKLHVQKELHKILISAMEKNEKHKSFHENLVDQFMKSVKETFGFSNNDEPTDDSNEMNRIDLLMQTISRERRQVVNLSPTSFKFRRCPHIEDLTTSFVTCKSCAVTLNEVLDVAENMKLQYKKELQTKQWIANCPTKTSTIDTRNSMAEESFYTCSEIDTTITSSHRKSNDKDNDDDDNDDKVDDDDDNDDKVDDDDDDNDDKVDDYNNYNDDEVDDDDDDDDYNDDKVDDDDDDDYNDYNDDKVDKVDDDNDYNDYNDKHDDNYNDREINSNGDGYFYGKCVTPIIDDDSSEYSTETTSSYRKKLMKYHHCRNSHDDGYFDSAQAVATVPRTVPPAIDDFNSSYETITSDCNKWHAERPFVKLAPGNTEGKCYNCGFFGHIAKKCDMKDGKNGTLEKYQKIANEKKAKFEKEKWMLNLKKFDGTKKCIRCGRPNDHKPKQCWREDGSMYECFWCWKKGVTLSNCPKCHIKYEELGGKYNAETRDVEAKATFVRVPPRSD